MVYESDFYTTRRPYSRALASSYTVTGPAIVPLSSIIQVRAYPHLPYVAHKRLVTFVHTPIHSAYHTGTPIPIRIHSRVRPSVLAAEYNRIRDLPRPSSKSYTENYLNSKDNIFFDDETRQIRAKADSLLRRIHVFVPRPAASDFHDEIVPERLRSDDYIRRLLGARKNVAKEIELESWYTVPEQRHLGKGNLACVQYVGGKPHSRRRPYYKLADLRPSDVKSDVNLLSYYSKNRQAAANASPASPLTERELRKARANESEWKPAPAPAPEPVSVFEAEPEPEIVPVKAASPPPAAPEESVAAPVVEKKKEKKEKKKEKEDGSVEDKEYLKLTKLLHLVCTVKKPTEEELARQAEEARLEEERRIQAEKEAEEARIAYEKAQEEARLAEIAEQERLEAERIAEEERMEAARLEAERLEDEERLAVEAAAAAEEERLAVLKAQEEEQKKLEEEERLAAEAAAAATELLSTDGVLHDEEPAELLENQQELEERQIDPIVEVEPQIDEVDVPEDEEDSHTGAETFVEEPVDIDGAGDSRQEEPIVDIESPKIEEVNSGSEDVWGDNEDA